MFNPWVNPYFSRVRLTKEFPFCLEFFPIGQVRVRRPIIPLIHKSHKAVGFTLTLFPPAPQFGCNSLNSAWIFYYKPFGIRSPEIIGLVFQLVKRLCPSPNLVFGQLCWLRSPFGMVAKF